MNLSKGEIIQMPLSAGFTFPYKNVVKEVNESHSRIKCLKCDESIRHELAEMSFGFVPAVDRFNNFIKKHEECK